MIQKHFFLVTDLESRMNRIDSCPVWEEIVKQLA